MGPGLLDRTPGAGVTGDPVGPGRDIQLLDTFNLRDLGGYPTVDGRRVRWRRLFRGAGLQRLTGSDVERVRDLGLMTAIDLRTSGELQASGGFPTAVLPAAVHHLPMITTIWDLADLDPEQPPDEYLVDRYRDMLDEGRATIAETMRILGRPESFPAVFYCAAGKDRTGVLAALVLDALGVEPEHTVEDYHRSHRHVERMRARAAGSAGDLPSAMVAQPAAFMQAPAGAMRLLLAWIRDEYGSTVSYLQSVGVTPATVAAMAANLLEPLPPR